MSKKEIEMFDVEIRFRVRKGTPGAKSVNELRKNVKGGIGCNDMNGIDAEEVEVNIK